MGENGCFSDPQNGTEGYVWVTVVLPPDVYSNNPSDIEVMVLALHELSKRNNTFDDRALHGLGAGCISIPVKGVPRSNPKVLRLYAEVIMNFWLNMMIQEKARLDQHTIFVATTPRAEHIHCMALPYEPTLPSALVQPFLHLRISESEPDV